MKLRWMMNLVPVRAWLLVALTVASTIASDSVLGCTTAVISGKITSDGRPILWKNRDTTSSLHNDVIFLDGGTHKALAVVNAGKKQSVWMGVNEAGFCIENSLSRDLAEPSGSEGPGNGSLMKLALEQCATVSDFRNLLEQTNISGRATAANYGVIDAKGGAALFETGPTTYQMFDANDPSVAPQGYIVRSNFSTTAQNLPGTPEPEQVRSITSGQRFLRACELLDSIDQGNINVGYVLRQIARDLADESGQPYPGSVNRPAESLPPVIPTGTTISRTTTVSTAVFHGVRDGEDPALTTMWAMLGDPKFSIAVPCWVSIGEIADPLTDPRGGELGEIAITLRDWNLNFDRDGILTRGMPGIWKDLWRSEDEILSETLAELNRFRVEGFLASDLTHLHSRLADRAMKAMQKELVEAKEAALTKFELAIPTVVKRIRVAIYDHSGGEGAGLKNLKRILDETTYCHAEPISPLEIRQGKLSEFDLLVMPGGSGSKQASMLEEQGRDAIRTFVANGGGYLGICAGSYLASSHYSWSLNLINTKVWDRAHWARGTGTVTIGFVSAATDLFEVTEPSVDVYYGQGPLMMPGNHPELPTYDVLAVYQTEIAEKGAPTNAMVGTHAVVRSEFGKGRVLCYSPHPEIENGPNWMITQGVRWLSHRDD